MGTYFDQGRKTMNIVYEQAREAIETYDKALAAYRAIPDEFCKEKEIAYQKLDMLRPAYLAAVEFDYADMRKSK
jgi:hypothetical protein